MRRPRSRQPVRLREGGPPAKAGSREPLRPGRRQRRPGRMGALRPARRGCGSGRRPPRSLPRSPGYLQANRTGNSSRGRPRQSAGPSRRATHRLPQQRLSGRRRTSIRNACPAAPEEAPETQRPSPLRAGRAGPRRIPISSASRRPLAHRRTRRRRDPRSRAALADTDGSSPHARFRAAAGGRSNRRCPSAAEPGFAMPGTHCWRRARPPDAG